MAAKIRKGDTVVVIAGKDKGKSGLVLSVAKAGERLVIEGVNLIKKHTKPNPNAGIEGGIVSKEAAIHISNVMIYNPASKKRDRVVFKMVDKDGVQKKIRCFASNQEPIDV